MPRDVAKIFFRENSGQTDNLAQLSKSEMISGTTKKTRLNIFYFARKTIFESELRRLRKKQHRPNSMEPNRFWHY